MYRKLELAEFQEEKEAQIIKVNTIAIGENT